MTSNTDNIKVDIKINQNIHIDFDNQLKKSVFENKVNIVPDNCDDCKFKPQFIKLLFHYLEEMKTHKCSSNEYLDLFVHLKHTAQVLCLIEGTKCELDWDVICNLDGSSNHNDHL